MIVFVLAVSRLDELNDVDERMITSFRPSVAVLKETGVGSPMASNALKQVWDSAQKKIDDGDAEAALEILRTGASDQAALKEVNTWRLAGDAKAMIARETKTRKMYRDAVNHYEKALKCSSNDKKSRRALNSIRSEMDGMGIRAGGMNVFWDDGAPTFMGLILFVCLLGGGLVGLKMLPDYFADDSDENKQYDYVATMEISYTPKNSQSLMTAQVVIGLHANESPIHVDNFVKLAERGEYNNVIFHRIINDFMIQGGDFEMQNGQGGYAAEFYGYCDGSPSASQCSSQTQYTIPDEANNGLLHSSCTISMAKTSAPNTGGSQFFLIPQDSNPSHLDGVHTVFGEITSGCEHVTAMSEVATGGNDKPVDDVTLLSVTIERTAIEDTSE